MSTPERCTICGAPAVRDVSNRDRRIELYRAAYKASVAAEREVVAADWALRILDLYREPHNWRCAAHADTCGSCFFRDGPLAACVTCGTPTCPDCAIAAVDGNTLAPTGGVMCCRCNPPSFGDGARLPEPAAPSPRAVLAS